MRGEYSKSVWFLEVLGELGIDSINARAKVRAFW